MNFDVNRLSKAIYSVAEKQNEIAKIGDALNSLAKFYKKNAAFRQLLITRRVEISQKSQILQNIFSEMPGLIFAMLDILMDARTTDILPKLAKQFHQIREEKSGLVNAIAFSAVKLDDSILTKIEQNLKAKFGENFNFSQKVESEMLGGLKLRIGNTIVDGSISSRMNKLRVALSQS